MTEKDEFSFQVSGMDCADCARTIERAVGELAGVSECDLSFATGIMRVHGAATAAEVSRRVEALGYRARPLTGQPAEAVSGAPVERGLWRYFYNRRDTRLAMLGALLLLPGLIFHELLPGLGREHWLMDAGALAAMALAGWPVARAGWRGFRFSRELNINSLMSIAALGAVFIGAYTEAGLVMVLFSLGEALEGYTGQQARRSLQSLLRVSPRTALRRDEHGAFHPVPATALVIDDQVLVPPGERIPADSQVMAGRSAVDQSPITGESLPVDLEPGDLVFAGSINGEGALQLRVLRSAADSTVSQIARLVAQAQAERAPVERLVNRFARIYTPAVVALALLVAVTPPLLFGAPLLDTDGGHGWLYRALALLVVACPCALVLSTPITLVSALTAAARQGIVVKGARHLETLSRVRVIAFDKTGTLTQNRPRVRQWRSIDCLDPAAETEPCPPCRQLLTMAGAVEQHSAHPLAQAVTRTARRWLENRQLPAAREVTSLTGQGLAGYVGETNVLVGSHAYFDQSVAHPPEVCSLLNDLNRSGQSTILVSLQGQYHGFITVADSLRPEAAGALAEMKRQGNIALVMLTGDSAGPALSVARELGLNDVQAGLLPADKLAAIRQLEARHGPVAMVGDGINDAPALAGASVGVALGVAGSAQALETADIGLMRDDLQLLGSALELSRRAMNTVRFNIAISLIVKLAFLILVLLGAGSLWLAVFADMGTSLLVSFNGLRLLGWRPGPSPASEILQQTDITA